jgi:uncharacterized protein (TIGR03437 family)
MVRARALLVAILAAAGAAEIPAVQNIFRLGGAPNGLSICGYGVDGEGTQYLAGNLFGSGFPIAGKTRFGPLGDADFYVAKISPSGDRLLYLIEMGGSGFDQCRAMTVDARGNVYVAGESRSTDFLTTAGAYLAAPTKGGAFAVRFDVTGRPVFSTFLDDSYVSAALAVAPDAAGNVLAGGAKEGNTPFETVGFLVKLSADGKTRLFSRLFEEGVTGRSSVQGIAIGPDAAVHLIGVDARGEIPRSYYRQLDASGSTVYSTLVFDSAEASLIRVDTLGNVYVAGTGSHFDLIKFDSEHRIVYQARIGGSKRDLLQAIDSKDDGTVWLGGWTESADFPTRDTLDSCSSGGNGAIVKLSPVGQIVRSTLLQSYNVAAIAGAQVAGTAGPAAFTFQLDESRWPQGSPAPSCLVNGASFEPVAAVPLLVSTLFGSNMAGATVTASGSPAPVLYAADTQVNFVFPVDLPAGPVNLCVQTTSGERCRPAPRAEASPAVFRVAGGLYAVLNPNGTLNSPRNPAERGSVIALYGTGFGSYRVTASIFDPPPPFPCRWCPPVFTKEYPMEVEYSGPAPFLIDGVTQINLRIPEGVVPSERNQVELRVSLPWGTLATEVYIAVKL